MNEFKLEAIIGNIQSDNQKDFDRIKSMTTKQIAEYVIQKYPNSCLAKNLEMNPDDWDFEEGLFEQVVDFFKYDILNLCGCGAPEDTIKVIVETLRLQNYFHLGIVDYDTHQAEYAKRLSINFKDGAHYGYWQFVLYILDSKKLMDHGGSVGGSWLTELGQICLVVLDRYIEEESKWANIIV